MLTEDDIAKLLWPVAPKDAKQIREFDVLDSRLDLAWLRSGSLHGIEIKTEAATLRRLPRQAEVYARFCTHCSVATVPQHIARVESILPQWWGVFEVNAAARLSNRFECLDVRRLRAPQLSPDFRPASLALRLTKAELMNILRKLGELRGVKSKTFLEQHDRLVKTFDDNAVKVVTLATMYANRENSPDWS